MKTKIISISVLLFLIEFSGKAQQWEFVGLDSLVIFQLYVSGDTIYAGTFDKINRLNSGLYFSSDRGISWIRLDSQLGEGGISLLERNIDNTLYIIKIYVAGRTLYRTTDNGQNWEVVNNVSNNPIQWFGISPFNPNEMFAIDVSGGGGNNFNSLYKSTNRGNSWASIGSFPGSSHGSEITFAFDLVDSMYLYVSVDDHWSSLYFFKSTDEGSNWFYISSPPFRPKDIYTDKIIPNRIYLFGGPYVDVSNNGGLSWFLADSGLTDTSSYVSFYQDKLTTESIYILSTDGIYESKTDTLYWNRLQGSENLPLDLVEGLSNQKNLAVDEKTKQIYVGTSSGIYSKSLITGLPAENSSQINTFILDQNFPNPFNSETIISYYIPFNTQVLLKVYDLLGNELKILVAEEKQKGTHKVKFSTEKLSSGVYIYSLITDSQRISKKMVLIK